MEDRYKRTILEELLRYKQSMAACGFFLQIKKQNRLESQSDPMMAKAKPPEQFLLKDLFGISRKAYIRAYVAAPKMMIQACNLQPTGMAAALVSSSIWRIAKWFRRFHLWTGHHPGIRGKDDHPSRKPWRSPSTLSQILVSHNGDSQTQSSATCCQVSWNSQQPEVLVPAICGLDLSWVWLFLPWSTDATFLGAPGCAF